MLQEGSKTTDELTTRTDKPIEMARGPARWLVRGPGPKAPDYPIRLGKLQLEGLSTCFGVLTKCGQRRRVLSSG